MKANKAPDKIYLYPYSTDGIYEVETKPLEGTVEYTRTDVLVEKVINYLRKELINFEEPVDTEKTFLEDVKKVMEE